MGELDRLREGLEHAQSARLAGDRQRWVRLGAALDALSPLKVLARGYAVARSQEGAVLREAGAVSPGDRVRVTLARGALDCAVENVIAEEGGPETHGGTEEGAGL